MYGALVPNDPGTPLQATEPAFFLGQPLPCSGDDAGLVGLVV